MPRGMSLHHNDPPQPRSTKSPSAGIGTRMSTATPARLRLRFAILAVGTILILGLAVFAPLNVWRSYRQAFVDFRKVKIFGGWSQ